MARINSPNGFGTVVAAIGRQSCQRGRSQLVTASVRCSGLRSRLATTSYCGFQWRFEIASRTGSGCIPCGSLRTSRRSGLNIWPINLAKRKLQQAIFKGIKHSTGSPGFYPEPAPGPQFIVCFNRSQFFECQKGTFPIESSEKADQGGQRPSTRPLSPTSATAQSTGSLWAASNYYPRYTALGPFLLQEPISQVCSS